MREVGFDSTVQQEAGGGMYIGPVGYLVRNVSTRKPSLGGTGPYIAGRCDLLNGVPTR